MKLITENLYLSYGEKEIVKDISICAGDREFIGIVGPNGSGKSTLLKCIYRILEPDKGCVWLDEKELSSYSYKDSAKKMAVVAQHNNYSFDFSVKDIVMMGRAPYKRALEPDYESDWGIVMDALSKVGMEQFAQRKYSSLSGGEKQRVILARALAQKASCLILDEPTNHLDITHQLGLMRLVKQLEITVIAAIHDLNLAALYCDKVYVVNSGAVVLKGIPEEVFTKEAIQDIYQVDCEITRDKNGHMHILYFP